MSPHLDGPCKTTAYLASILRHGNPRRILFGQSIPPKTTPPRASPEGFFPSLRRQAAPAPANRRAAHRAGDASTAIAAVASEQYCTPSIDVFHRTTVFSPSSRKTHDVANSSRVARRFLKNRDLSSTDRDFLGIVHRARDAMPPATTSKQTSTARRSVDASCRVVRGGQGAIDGDRRQHEAQRAATVFLQALLARGIMDSEMRKVCTGASCPRANGSARGEAPRARRRRENSDSPWSWLEQRNRRGRQSGRFHGILGRDCDRVKVFRP